MFVTIDQIQNGVVNFIEIEIAAKAVGANKFFAYFIIPRVHKIVEDYIMTLSDNPMTRDLFDENKNLNIDEIYNMAKQAIRKSGQFTYFGIIFNETDIDKLYNYIK